LAAGVERKDRHLDEVESRTPEQQANQDRERYQDAEGDVQHVLEQKLLGIRLESDLGGGERLAERGVLDRPFLKPDHLLRNDTDRGADQEVCEGVGVGPAIP
jgi:hypothetical protein